MGHFNLSGCINMQKCPYCNVWFKNQHALSVHIAMAHKRHTPKDKWVSDGPMFEIQKILKRYGVK